MGERSAMARTDGTHHGELSPRSEDIGSSQLARPYECYFCKRGFSTAQALGGHMNIHRKDRAKQKQQPAATNHAASSLFLDPPNLSFSHSAALKEKESHSISTCVNGGESEASRIMRCPWNYYRRGGFHHEEIGAVRPRPPRQLPLLVDTAFGDGGYGGQRPLKKSSSELLTPVAVVEELDLELRLGPTPCGGATGGKIRRLCMEAKEVRRPWMKDT